MSLKLLTFPVLSSFVLPISIVNLNFHSNSDIVLATYQSYISDDVATEANSKFGVQTVYFENDRDILSGFKIGAYDVAIMSSSTLEEAINKKIVKRIDWSKFESLSDEFKNKMKGVNGSQNNNQFPTEQSIYSPIVNKLFKEKPQLSQYGLPYFLSYLLFAYRCKECSSIQENSQNWKEELQKIIQKYEELKIPFNFGMIEDEVTILSLSKLASDNHKNGQDWNHKKDERVDFFNKYKNLSKLGLKSKNKSNSIFMNSDSALMSEMFIKNQLKGVFMYNGDALSSYKEIKDNQKEKTSEFKILTPFPSLWLLDQIAISYKVDKYKEEKIYQFLNKLLFEGGVTKNNSSQGAQNTQLTTINKKDSWVWKNFDYLQYTPVLKEMQEEIKKNKENGKSSEKPETQTEGEKYDDMTIKLLFGGNNEEKCKVEKNPPQEDKDCNIVFESGMSDSQNLDLSLSFQRWKNSKSF